MKHDHLTIVVNTVLACAAAIVLLTPKLAHSVQVEPSASTPAGNPVEDRVSLPREAQPQQRPSAQPIKTQIALQTEIDNLKAVVNKASAGVAGKTTPTALQQREDKLPTRRGYWACCLPTVLELRLITAKHCCVSDKPNNLAKLQPLLVWHGVRFKAARACRPPTKPALG